MFASVRIAALRSAGWLGRRMRHLIGSSSPAITFSDERCTAATYRRENPAFRANLTESGNIAAVIVHTIDARGRRSKRPKAPLQDFE
jgi:hypothetical protein